MKTRNQIDEKYKWDLSCYGVNDQNFEQKCKEVENFEKQIYAFKGHLDSDEQLLKILKLIIKRDLLFQPICMYVHLKGVEDLSDSRYDEMEDKLQKISINFSKNTLFFDFFLKKMPIGHINQLLADKRFKEFSLMLEDLKEDKKHQLPNSVDKFLAGADFLGQNSEIMQKFVDIDMKYDDISDKNGKKYKLDDVLLSRYLESDDRELRKNALKSCHGAFGQNIDMLAANYIGSVKETCFFVKARKYPSAISAAMQEEKVSQKVYAMLIENVHKNLPLLFDYFELKRQKMGLGDFANYDTYFPICSGENEKFSYDQAIELVKKAVSPLGEEYVGLIQRAKDERWIDVFPNKNKRSGAFETCIYGHHPFVMTNFDGKLEDVFTLAHELGHAMHSYFSDKHQDFEKAQYPIFLAEIASTTNEMLLLQYLLSQTKSAKEKEKLYDKLFMSVKSTIFRQTMFAEFEEKVHALHESGEALSKDRLCKIYYDLNKDYFGKKVKLLDEVQFEWARIPHFFTPFYVFKYATGLICALNFSQMLTSDKNYAKTYIEKFLSAGQSKKPNEILKDAGCDLEDEKTYKSTFEFLKNKLDEWKNLTKNK